jgi:hypothetical protein
LLIFVAVVADSNSQQQSLLLLVLLGLYSEKFSLYRKNPKKKPGCNNSRVKKIESTNIILFASGFYFYGICHFYSAYIQSKFAHKRRKQRRKKEVQNVESFVFIEFYG